MAMLSMLQALYNLVHTICVSRIGEDTITALSMAYPAQHLMTAVMVGIGVPAFRIIIISFIFG